MNFAYKDYRESSNMRIHAFYSHLSGAVVRAETAAQINYPSVAANINKKTNILGLTAVPYDAQESYGMVSCYAPESTPEDPLIQISSNYGGEQRVYNVHVKQVNPACASQLEMFALCSYTDDIGITPRGTFGTYSRMKTYAMNAQINGAFADLQNPTVVGNTFDWIEMLKYVAKQYLMNSETYKQYLDANGLAGTFTDWKNKSYTIGAQAYTLKEWNKLIQSVDYAIEDIIEEQKIRFEEIEEERLNQIIKDRT